MPNDSVQNTGAQDIAINIPDSVKKNLPRDFNLNDIGNIDLREAEKIANEDILFLNEKDLAEGLEDLDLIPLKDVMGEEAKRSARSSVSRTPAVNDSVPKAAVASPREVLLSSGTKSKRDEESGVPLEYIDSPVDSEKDFPRIVEQAAAVPPAPTRVAEGYIEGDDEYVIWDMPEGDGGTAQSKIIKASPTVEAPKPAAEVEKARPAETKKTPEAKEKPQYAPERDDVVISIEDLDEKIPLTTKTVHAELIPLEEIDAVPQAASTTPLERERIDRISRPYQKAAHDDGPATGEAFFIDDKQQLDQEARNDAFDESGLEKIASGIVQVDEGSSYVLEESDVLEDRERIVAIADEFRPAYEEFLRRPGL